MFFLYCICVDK